MLSRGRRLTTAAIAVATLGTGLAGLMGTDAQAAATSSTACTSAVDANHFACTIQGTTDQASITLPLSHSAGVTMPTGTSQMASGAGTMTVAADHVTFTFSKAYTATHTAPYSFSGGFMVAVNRATIAGPFSITVDGRTVVVAPQQKPCGEACEGGPIAHGTFKSAWDLGDSRSHFELVRGGESVVAGQPITFVDHAGVGQSQCTGQVQQQNAAGAWINVGVPASADAAGTTLSATWTPSTTGAVRLLGSCATDAQHSVYSDRGSIAGIAVSAESKVTGAWADGHGTTPSKPTTPSRPAMVTETYQVDTATVKGSSVAWNKYLAADDDSRLVYRELGSLWQDRTLARHFSEQHQYVTITVPANATAAQREAAINARTVHGDVHSTAKLGTTRATGGTVTYAWLIDTAHGARPVDGGMAWGAHHNLAQRFFARS